MAFDVATSRLGPVNLNLIGYSIPSIQMENLHFRIASLEIPSYASVCVIEYVTKLLHSYLAGGGTNPTVLHITRTHSAGMVSIFC